MGVLQESTAAAKPSRSTASDREVTRLRDLSAQQWKSGIAAWLGWLFDGLDMHLYILVAAPFVAELLGVVSAKDPAVGFYSSWIQAGLNLGTMPAGLATFLLAGCPSRCVFLVGLRPALLVLWIRRAVPEPEEWEGARRATGAAVPGFLELFRGPVRRTAVLTLLVCAFSLTAHWAFLFWYVQHLRNLPELSAW